jgi:hypothetical protein
MRSSECSPVQSEGAGCPSDTIIHSPHSLPPPYFMFEAAFAAGNGGGEKSGRFLDGLTRVDWSLPLSKQKERCQTCAKPSLGTELKIAHSHFSSRNPTSQTSARGYLSRRRMVLIRAPRLGYAPMTSSMVCPWATTTKPRVIFDWSGLIQGSRP